MRAPMTTLRKGDHGGEVRELAGLLDAKGYGFWHPADEFGAAMKSAVLDFQARHLDPRGQPLVADGVVGSLTWWALNQKRVVTPKPKGSFIIPDGGSDRGRAALRVGFRELRAGAVEIGANNSGRFVKKYLNGLTGMPANWCAAFVSHCFDESGEMPFKYSLGARNIRNQLKKKDWTYEDVSVEPAPGDIVFWWRGRPKGWQGHIGLVWKVENGILYTLEGNKGTFPARVNTFQYVLSRVPKILGFAQIPSGLT